VDGFSGALDAVYVRGEAYLAARGREAKPLPSFRKSSTIAELC
jgi:hypothetical protein